MSEPNPNAAGDKSVESHDTAHDAAHFHNHAKLYLFIGAALMVLTGVTVAVSYIPFKTVEMHIGMGLLVAIVKSVLVAAIFMHLKEEKGTIYQFMTIALIFLIALFALCVLAIKDPIVM